MVAPAALPHRERMLRTGTALLYRFGYHGTSVDAVLAATGVPKGSFYHHFGSKEGFAAAVIERYEAEQTERLRCWVVRAELPVPQRLAGYHWSMVDAFVASGQERGCLLGALSQELGGGSDAFRLRLAAGFRRWRDALADLLAEGAVRGEVRGDLAPAVLADGVLALIEGGFVAALSVGERAPLDAVTLALVDLVSAPEPA